MKLLLDECMDHALRTRIPGRNVFTVRYMGWAGLKNGQLLRQAADAGFDALLTTDRGMRNQHNPATLPLPIVTLNAASNDAGDVLALVPRLLAVLASLTPRTFADVP